MQLRTRLLAVGTYTHDSSGILVTVVSHRQSTAQPSNSQVKQNAMRSRPSCLRHMPASLPSDGTPQQQQRGSATSC